MADRHGITRVRVRPGHDVTLLNVSADGALIETAHRLLPGSSIELQVSAGARAASVRSRVLRCHVSRLHSELVIYRGAVRFERRLPLFGEEHHRGYHVHAEDHARRREAGAEDSPTVL